jgi:exopolysaccharide biosynthesis polyprenyl glycosylphosphotransferase
VARRYKGFVNRCSFMTEQMQTTRTPARSPSARWRRRLRGPRSPTITPAPVDAESTPIWEVVPGVDDVPEPMGYSIPLRRDAMFRRTLALADVLGSSAALLIAVLLVDGGRVGLRPTTLLLAPFVVLVSKTIGLYDRDQHTMRKTTVDEVPSIFHLSVIFALTTWLAEAFFLHGWLARPQVFTLAVCTFGFVAVGRSVVRAIALSVSPPERCVVLGNAADAQRTAEKFENSSRVKADVLGRIALRTDDVHHRNDREDLLGDMRSLAQVISEHRVERVIIAPDGHDQEEILHAIRLVKAFGVKVSVLPRLLEVVGSSSTFDDVDGMTLIGLRRYGLSKSSALLKRMLDIGATAVGLALLAPLFVLIAICVKLDSRGSVFFRQPRIGRSGRTFGMLKFRSMVQDAEREKRQLRSQNEAEGGLFKISDDPRITRVGRLLRRTSLDELPQLLNVLKGDMSLVGPRPLIPDEDALIEGWERRRLAVNPGMTGLWQVFGSSRIPMAEMVKIDYLYGANWSIWLDLKILLRTIPYVFRRRGM